MISKSIIKKFIPPIILDAIRPLRNIGKNEAGKFLGPFSSFKHVPESVGWDNDEWVKLSKAKIASLVEQHDTAFTLGYHSHLVSHINDIIIKKGNCVVVDFAGGSGFSYFNIRNCVNKNKLSYFCYDLNKSLYDIGSCYLENSDTLNYINTLNEVTNADILFCNVSIHYLESIEPIISFLKKATPQYIILTRCYIGSCPTNIFSQLIEGGRLPIKISNIQDMDDTLNNVGYEKILYERNSNEEVFSAFAEEVPHNLRIKNSKNIIYTRK